MSITIDWYNYVPTLLSGLIYAYLVFRGMRGHMLEEFRTFYLYVVVSSLTSIANWTVIGAFGFSSLAYLYTYYSGQAVKVLCEIAILAAIYDRLHRPAGVSRYVPALFAIAAISGEAWALQTLWIWDAAAVPMLVQFVFLILIWVPGLLRRRISRLGLNWCGLLVGLSLGVLLEFNHLALSMVDGLEPGLWRRLLQPIEFAPWVIFALTMGSPDKTRISRWRRSRKPADTAEADRNRSAPAPLVPQVVRRVR